MSCSWINHFPRLSSWIKAREHVRAFFSGLHSTTSISERLACCASDIWSNFSEQVPRFGPSCDKQQRSKFIETAMMLQKGKQMENHQCLLYKLGCWFLPVARAPSHMFLPEATTCSCLAPNSLFVCSSIADWCRGNAIENAFNGFEMEMAKRTMSELSSTSSCTISTLVSCMFHREKSRNICTAFVWKGNCWCKLSPPACSNRTTKRSGGNLSFVSLANKENATKSAPQ